MILPGKNKAMPWNVQNEYEAWLARDFDFNQILEKRRKDVKGPNEKANICFMEPH